MEAILPWILSLISGAVGGNVAGAAMKDKSLGTLGNSIVGLLGGGMGGALLKWLGVAVTTAEASGFNVTQMLSNVAGGGVGGAILLAIVAMARKAGRPA